MSADNTKTKRGPVVGPTLDFLQQIKKDATEPMVVNHDEEDDENNNMNKKKKESKSKLEPEISYEEWKPPEGKKNIYTPS